MAWYRTGTISLTNNSVTVTGSGTSFLDTARVGDALVISHNEIYEILNIATNTQLTLATPYRGTTKSGANYALLPNQGYQRYLADKVQELIDSYSLPIDAGDVDGLATVATSGQYSDLSGKPTLGTAASRNVGTATGNLMEVNAFGLGGTGTNNISPTNLQTLVPNGFYHGVGVSGENYPGTTRYGNMISMRRGSNIASVFLHSPTTAADVYIYSTVNGSDWTTTKLMSDGNILGTVSQTGGVPTGAIIERGSNANGEYVKFTDGTQICRTTLIFGTYVAVGPTGHAFDQASRSWPAAFSGIPTLTMSAVSGTSNMSTFFYRSDLVSSTTTPTSTGRIRVATDRDVTGEQITVSVCGIGRWY